MCQVTYFLCEEHEFEVHAIKINQCDGAIPNEDLFNRFIFVSDYKFYLSKPIGCNDLRFDPKPQLLEACPQWLAGLSPSYPIE